MTPEYQSKLNDAFRMVMEEASKRSEVFQENVTEEMAIEGIDEIVGCLGQNYISGSMQHQRKNCKTIAAHAILYMVKFL